MMCLTLLKLNLAGLQGRRNVCLEQQRLLPTHHELQSRRKLQVFPHYIQFVLYLTRNKILICRKINYWSAFFIHWHFLSIKLASVCYTIPSVFSSSYFSYIFPWNFVGFFLTPWIPTHTAFPRVHQDLHCNTVIYNNNLWQKFLYQFSMLVRNLIFHRQRTLES